MRAEALRVGAVVAFVVLSGHWCEQETLEVSSGDGGGIDAPADEGDVAADVLDEPDAVAPSGPGPLTLVVAELEVATDRVCDLDGDGSPDNSVADLGSPGSSLFAVGIETILWSGRGMDAYIGIHLAWVDDHSGPTADDGLAAVLIVEDGDEPSDASDDFSGEESFYAAPVSLGRCGEPLAVTQASLVHGELAWTGGEVALPLPGGDVLTLAGVDYEGVVEPFGESFSSRVCGYSTIRALGEIPAPGLSLSLLEALTYGGAALGIGELPGLEPDVDLDGDGFERVAVDADGRVTECIDGDGTSIVGNDCFGDPRMADGISFTFELSGTRGHLAGRAPGWEYRWPPCDEGLPDASFFDTLPTPEGPCAGLGAVCVPSRSAPCCDPEHLCSGADQGAYRCLPPCEPPLCAYGSEPGYCPAGSGDSGLCQPYLRRPEPTVCELATTGCETEYGETSATYCGRSGGETYCLEQCEVSPDACPDAFWFCVPNVLQGGGVCVLRR